MSPPSALAVLSLVSSPHASVLLPIPKIWPGLHMCVCGFFLFFFHIDLPPLLLSDAPPEGIRVVEGQGAFLQFDWTRS